MIAVTVLCALFAAAWPAPAGAQQIPAASSAEPLEITADQSLEWHRNDRKFIARSNVVARQGDVAIAADTLTADYRDTGKTGFEIYRLTAEGNVRITSRGNTATGARAVYEVDTGIAQMTGDNLRLESPDQVVTAKESFEYRTADGRLTAKGDAVVERAGDRLAAQSVSAIFRDPGAGGARQLDRLTAEGGVRITTAAEVLTGERGEYNAASNIARVTGTVKITRGPNVLEGDSAEVNLATNISTMTGNAASGGRVRGVFYPGSEEKNPFSGAPGSSPGGNAATGGDKTPPAPYNPVQVQMPGAATEPAAGQ